MKIAIEFLAAAGWLAFGWQWVQTRRQARRLAAAQDTTERAIKCARDFQDVAGRAVRCCNGLSFLCLLAIAATVYWIFFRRFSK